MTKLNLSLGMLLIGSAFLAGNFIACSSSKDAGGTAGTVGTAGTSATAGTGGGGTAGTGTAGGTGTPGATMADGKTCVPNAFHRPTKTDPCTCQEGTTDVCAVVGCTNKKLDVANCGTCGNVCGATAACNAGACGVAPTVVLPAVAGCTGMTVAISGGAVYYTDAAHNSVSKVGGTAITGEMGATMLAAAGTNLFWYDAGTKKIRMVAAGGTTPTDVYTDAAAGVDGGAAPVIAGFLVDGANIYISQGTQVLKAPVAGGTPTVVANEVEGGLPAALALNGTTNIVFPATFNGDVDAPLLSANPAICGMKNAVGDDIMTTCPRLGRSQGELLPNFMAVIAGKAYWVDGSNLKSETITVGSTFDSISMAQGSITAAVGGTDTIYFAEDGIVEKTPAAVPTATTPPIIMARGQMAPQSMALDATKVYWATKDCSIGSIAK